MAFKARPLRVVSARYADMRLVFRGEHIRLKLHHHSVFTKLNLPYLFISGPLLRRHRRQLLRAQFRKFHFLLAGRRKAIIQIDPAVVVRKHSRIERHIFPQNRAVMQIFRILYMPVERKGPCRGIAHSNTDFRVKAKAIIKVIPAVRPLRHVRRPKLHAAIRIGRVLIFPVNDALISPVLKIVYRGGPRHIILLTVSGSLRLVVRAVYVYPAVKNVGLPVRHIFRKR